MLLWSSLEGMLVLSLSYAFLGGECVQYYLMRRLLSLVSVTRRDIISSMSFS